jgi:type II secretory ATPase GspE/PulE/Tfp pilus assembly ATPase PilB-like protein
MQTRKPCRNVVGTEGRYDLENNEPNAPEVLERLVQQAESAGASDIHLQMRQGGAAVWFRLDGVMTPTSELASEIAERVFGRIKFLARLKTYQDSVPQDGRIDKGTLSTRSDIRVATYPTVTGEKIVLRLFSAGGVKSLDELGMPDPARAELEQFLAQTFGMLLLTGPAGSGKTTTIYACLEALSRNGGRHVITVEDPAEQIIPGVMQTEVNEARGLSFATAARHLLRQDPQVLVIGEIRDDETANIAVRAALTGHLVISALHAGSCKGVFERLLVLCRDHSAVTASVGLVMNQRLLRRLCPSCNGSGCASCLRTGYRGRVPLVEWVHVTEPLRKRLAAHDLNGITPSASLSVEAKRLVQDGITNGEEVERVLGPAEMVEPLNR